MNINDLMLIFLGAALQSLIILFLLLLLAPDFIHRLNARTCQDCILNDKEKNQAQTPKIQIVPLNDKLEMCTRCLNFERCPMFNLMDPECCNAYEPINIAESENK